MAKDEAKKSATKVVTGKVRMSYVQVFEPNPDDAEIDAGKYSVSLLIPKNDTATIKKIKAAIEAAKQEGKTSKWGGKIPAKLENPLHDGDIDKEDDPVYADHYYLNAKSSKQPEVVDRALNPILDADEFYSGCYGRASINFFAYDKSGNKGIGCGLNNLQKLADGEPLTGRSRAEDDFADEYEDDEDDDF